MRPKVKICGITNLEDALAAARRGADYLGFIFAETSPRFVTPEAAKGMVAHVPADILKVGVFVDTSADQVVKTLHVCGLDIAQLCGDETAADVAVIGAGRVWKAWHLMTAADVAAAAEFPAAAILADTMLPGQRGGTGKVCDWDLAARLSGRRPIVLAGGITAENIAAAAAAVKPAVIDIGSGVEASPGRKDTRKLDALFGVVKDMKDL
ncbi:MAG: phosphoribosylanthranilate isomerase [Lentisphaeria bacterium]|nr:phosphoribosylanthranilate isomerase [Lentisphaeria bacterium]